MIYLSIVYCMYVIYVSNVLVRLYSFIIFTDVQNGAELVNLNVMHGETIYERATNLYGEHFFYE